MQRLKDYIRLLRDRRYTLPVRSLTPLKLESKRRYMGSLNREIYITQTEQRDTYTL